jgi:hypothetical protein
MTKPNLQPERIIASDDAHAIGAQIVEIPNVTIKAALKIVRDQIARDQSREHQ